MHFRLFDRPLIFDGPLSSMYIDGQYADYEPGSAYEGRVQIHGSVGYTKVEILESNIPPGAYVYVDNVFKQVVVKWPQYTLPTDTFTLLENGDFSQGDTGAWSNTGPSNPFSINADDNGNSSLEFKSGFRGAHYSEGPFAPITDINRQITATGRIAQGKSSKRNLWGGIVLAFHDQNRNILNYLESNWVNSGGPYQDVTVTAAASDVRAKFVSVRVHFDRRGQNHPGWADDIKWNHSWTKGYNSEDQLFLRIRVTDSLNNVAEHRGVIDESSLWVTSMPYDYYMLDSLTESADIGNGGTNMFPPENLQAVASFLSASTSVDVFYTTYTTRADSLRSTSSFVSASTTVEVQYETHTVRPEALRPAASFLSAQTQVLNFIRRMPPEGIRSGATFISGSTT